MPTTTPIFVALALLFASLIPGWRHPLKTERAELRVGHGIADRNSDQPSGFQLTSLFASAEVPLTEPIGPPRARGRIVWNPELELGIFSVPNVRPLVGLHPVQFKYVLEPIGKWSPYLIAGVGAIHSKIDRPETGSDYNISLMLGAGIRYLLSPNTSWLLEYRRRHVSNISTSDQNSGIDSHNILAGISIRL